MILIVDCYDSFSFNLRHYVSSEGHDCLCLRPEQLSRDMIRKLNPDGIILSPGPGRPSDYPLLADILNDYAGAKPILGICLGYQAIGVFYGAALEHCSAPFHGKAREIIHEEHDMFRRIPKKAKVARYHSLKLTGLPSCLLCTAVDHEGTAMAIAHKSYPVWGFQFHPEAYLTAHGRQYLLNWLEKTIG